MNGFVSGLRPIVDAITVPLILAVCLVIVVAITRSLSFLWYRVRQRGRRPLVIKTGGEKGAAGRSAKLDSRLLAYLSDDVGGGYVIAPGGGGAATPRVTAEALEPADSWVARLLRMAIAPEPSYQVEVAWPLDSETEAEQNAVVHISGVPGDRVLASASFDGSPDELVENIGCFSITFLRSRRRLLSHTPRWERWSQDIGGYRAYRNGLEHQRRGMRIPSLEESMPEYRKALSRFQEAARVEPANLLVQLHRAALLELMGEYRDAADTYQRCHALWPESIETAYRLGNALKNMPDGVTYAGRLQYLGAMKAQLSRRSLLKAWLRTLRPWRWNPGERHYWRTWLQLRLPGRVSKRATYLHGVAIGVLLAELSHLRSHDHDSVGVGRREMTKLMDRFAGEILRPGKAPTLARLLHPEIRKPGTAEHDHAWHTEVSGGVSWAAATNLGRDHRTDIGWLASYNAACFFSLASKLTKKQLPEVFGDKLKDWKEDCARAAIRELGILVRNPRHALEPDWLRTDPDLEPLRRSSTGRAWASFVDL